jgi:hypothetical protein
LADQNALPADGPLEVQLCQVVGLNQNYNSSSGTLYHIQIEDRGPLLDRVTEQSVRRLNVVIYANYGEANARIVHGRDHDLPDLRTHAHNTAVQQHIQQLAGEARQIIEEKEQRQVLRIKCLIREYYHTKNEEMKREFEEANGLYPFLFSRAWRELREERGRVVEAAAAAAELAPVSPPVAPVPARPPETEVVEAPPEEVLYPLESDLRELVIEIERIVIELGQDLQELRRTGRVDDILLQTCRKLVTRAKESISGREPSEFSTRRLEMTRNALMTTWRQVKSRLRSA